MLSINDLFQQRPVVLEERKRRTERGDLLEYFRDKINAERIGTKYQPLTTKRVAAGYLWHMKNLSDLYYLKSVCDSEEKRGKSWSKTFFYSIKISTAYAQEGIARDVRGMG